MSKTHTSKKKKALIDKKFTKRLEKALVKIDRRREQYEKRGEYDPNMLIYYFAKREE